MVKTPLLNVAQLTAGVCKNIAPLRKISRNLLMSPKPGVLPLKRTVSVVMEKWRHWERKGLGLSKGVRRRGSDSQRPFPTGDAAECSHEWPVPGRRGQARSSAVAHRGCDCGPHRCQRVTWKLTVSSWQLRGPMRGSGGEPGR